MKPSWLLKPYDSGAILFLSELMLAFSMKDLFSKIQFQLLHLDSGPKCNKNSPKYDEHKFLLFLLAITKIL